MERPGGSVRHVPSQLSKGVLSRRGLSGPASVPAGGGAVAAVGGTVDAAEREAFERGQVREGGAPEETYGGGGEVLGGSDAS